jgi:hypothetical protein
MGAARLQRQFLKLHTSALQSFAVAGYQSSKLHAHSGCCPAAVAGYQTACARGWPAAVSVFQTASLSKGRANMQQQQSKMYTRGALQALAGKNLSIHHHNNTFKDISQWKPWKNVYKVRKLQLQTRQLLLMNLADVPSKFQRMSASEIAQKPKNRMKIEG